MAKELQKKLQNAVDKTISDIDVTKMRGLQKEAYLNMSKCFDGYNVTAEGIQRCLGTQSNLLQATQNLIQQEMNVFQDRLQRCSMACQDEIRDKGLESSPEKAESHMVKCASVCVDRHIALLPGLKTKICNSIDQIKKG